MNEIMAIFNLTLSIINLIVIVLIARYIKTLKDASMAHLLYIHYP